MSNITLIIGGRNFTVACAKGEEEHVAALGRMIDGKLTSMGDAGGQSEARMLLFAALLLADELHDLRSTISPAANEALGESLARIADRLENLASHLEGGASSA